MGSKDDATARFVEVLVEGAPDCEEVCLRFRAADAPRPVRRLRHTPDLPPGGVRGPAWFRAYARGEDGALSPAMAAAVEDSSAGVSMLVVGGAHGVWLVAEDGGDGLAEAYLLLARDAVERD